MLIVPQAAPVHPVPDKANVTAWFVVPVTVAENCRVPPVKTVAAVGLRVTATPTVIVIVPVAVFVGSATLVAVIVTVAGDGTIPGAVYRPAVLTDPHAAPVHPIPVNENVTAVLVDPVTTVANCSVPPVDTVALVGLMAIVTGGAAIVTVAVEDLPGSATLVAVTVTVAGEGTVAGAVYNPVALMVPQAAPVQPAPETEKLTEVLVAPVTVGVNCCVPPVRTEAVDGLSVMATPLTIVTPAVADFVVSATLVARTVTVGGDGKIPGAV